MALAYEQIARQGGRAALELLSNFFMLDNPVRQSLTKITTRLGELKIDHAIVGGMALVLHGYERATTDVDLLVTSDGLQAIHSALDGLGYVPPFAGSKHLRDHLRDAETSVRIDFLVAGLYPGDGVAKPVAFPDPRTASVEIDGFQVIALERLLELKLASGMTNAGRFKDLGDVQELIRIRELDELTAESLHEYVRPKFLELLEGVRSDITDF